MRSHALLDHPEAETFQRGLGENHLSKLEFLLAQRLRHLHNPEVPWPRMGQLEARALAHSEALHAGGEAGLSQARELLAQEDVDRVRAGAYALALHGAQGMDEVLRALARSSGELLPAWFEALALVPHSAVAVGLHRLLGSHLPEVRASAAQLLGWRREGEAARLLPLLADSFSPVRMAAALALARLRHLPALQALEARALQSSPTEAAELLRAAVLLGSSGALQQVRHLCDSTREPPALLLHLLALAGEEMDVVRLQRWVAQPSLTAPTLQVLGVLGVPSTVPMLLEHLGAEEPETSLAAAGALALMTGAPLLHQVRLRSDSDEEGEEPSGPRVELPVTEPNPWQSWWKENRARFSQAPRWRRGKPFSVGACLAELKEPYSSLEMRTRAAWELTLRTRQLVDFEPDWPVVRQQQALNQWQKMLELRGNGWDWMRTAELGRRS